MLSTKACKLSPLEATFVALWKTLNSPICKRLIVSKVTNSIVTTISNKIPINTKNDFVLRRLLRKQEQSREQSMPKEWIGNKTVNRTIVYHEADKAGPHVESYIEIDGTAYNIGVKRLTPEMCKNISKNYNNELTLKSKEYILNLIRKEYENGAWLAQTTDHTPDESKYTWLTRKDSVIGYGAGATRQIVSECKISIFKTGNTIEFFDWDLSNNKSCYIFGLMQPNDRRNSRILKLGLKKITHKQFKERLHLKPHIGKESFNKFKEKVGIDGIITLKEDGASCYFETTKNGTNVFSPRISKVTGERIIYNNKINDIIHVKYDQNISGMGELTFVKGNRILNANETAGILNSNSPIPDKVTPRIVIYRIDKIGHVDVHDLSYNENLALITRFVNSCNNNKIQAPKIVSWNKALEVATKHEGLVGIPQGHSILDGYKFKPRHDEFDWTVTGIDLKPGDKGGIAGVVWFKSESGKQFKIGASSMGNREVATDIMNNPDKYIGRVAKISSYKGHEGRAPRFVIWHEAKGEA